MEAKIQRRKVKDNEIKQEIILSKISELEDLSQLFRGYKSESETVVQRVLVGARYDFVTVEIFSPFF